MARKLDPKVAEAVMLNAGLKPLEPYTGAVAKWKCLHIPCGEVVYAQYNMIQNGRGGCRKCGNESRFAKSRLTQSEVDLRLKEKGLIPLEKYFNSSTAFNCKCIKCGGIQEVKFRNINKVHGCAKCGLKLGGLKGRVSQEKAIKTMKLLDLEPLEPVLLHRETIGTSALMGAITFVALHQFSFGDNICAIVGGSVVILTRVVSIHFDLHLPKFTK